MNKKVDDFLDSRGSISDSYGNLKFTGSMLEVVERAVGIVKSEHADFIHENEKRMKTKQNEYFNTSRKNENVEHI